MMAEWNPNLEPREGSREDVPSETGTWQTAAVAFLPGKAAASLRADVMLTRPQGSSPHTTDVPS